MEPTPTEYRERYNEWSKTASANDSDIIPQPARRSESPRHHQLMRELKGLLFWRYISDPVQPLSTNWMAADNDNECDDDDGQHRSPNTLVECEHVIRPSADEIDRALDGVTFVIRPDGRKVPVPGPNVEYGPEEPFCWRSKINGMKLNGSTRPVARIGALRFSTADSVGEGVKKTPGRGELIAWRAGTGQYGRRVGDAFGAPRGCSDNKCSVDTSSVEADEWFTRIDQSIALRSKLSRNDAAALDAALHASTFEDVGEALGFKGKTAERQGKRRLLAASKNLSDLIDREAA